MVKRIKRELVKESLVMKLYSFLQHHKIACGKPGFNLFDFIYQFIEANSTPNKKYEAQKQKKKKAIRRKPRNHRPPRGK